MKDLMRIEHSGYCAGGDEPWVNSVANYEMSSDPAVNQERHNKAVEAIEELLEKNFVAKAGGPNADRTAWALVCLKGEFMRATPVMISDKSVVPTEAYNVGLGHRLDWAKPGSGKTVVYLDCTYAFVLKTKLAKPEKVGAT